MEFELEWVDPSLVICRTSGVGTVEGYEAFMRALTSDPQFRPGVDVITLDAVGRSRAALRRLSMAGPPVSAEPRQHKLHHVALAMVRRRRVSKYQQFHLARDRHTAIICLSKLTG